MMRTFFTGFPSNVFISFHIFFGQPISQRLKIFQKSSRIHLPLTRDLLHRILPRFRRTQLQHRSNISAINISTLELYSYNGAYQTYFSRFPASLLS